MMTTVGLFNKFQCIQCKGIVVTEISDNVVRCGHCDALCSVPDEPGPGVVIDDFLIEKLLGKGGMGNVFLAHQHSLDRKVALKIMHPKFQQDQKFNLEFVKEARSVASLNHPNIIQAYKVGEENGMLFFAMEMVDGRNLLSMIREDGPIEEKDIYSIAIDVATALGYAWEKSKLVHRDIKPENIMLTGDGDAKVMDLGLSKRGDEADEDTEIISGTPQYISPEQIIGEEVDIRTDFYSLGASLFHMLTGRFVFEAENIQDMVKMHMSAKPPALHKLNGDISEGLSRIVRKLLAKHKEKRYASAEELIVDLKKSRKALTKDRSSKRHFNVNTDFSVTKSKSYRRPSKKKTSPVPVIAVVAVLMLVGIVIASASGGSSIVTTVKKETAGKDSDKSKSKSEERADLRKSLVQKIKNAEAKTVKAADIPKVNILYLYDSKEEDLTGPLHSCLNKYSAKLTAVDVQGKNYKVPEGQQLIVISDSVQSTDIGKRFKDEGVPVILWESSLYDDMGLTGKAANKDYSQDSSNAVSDSILVNSVHPIAARLSGSVKVYTSMKSNINWGKPAADADIIATVPGKPEKAAVFCYERGAQMVSGTAKARRVGIYLGKKSLKKLTKDGIKILDAALFWALQDKGVKK